ncbi:hypothetical protein [Pseudorhodoplanes sp.]|uniref:hypothetical protein n=1 Tax=Pseudorhodoplanes sp. TaxID=1934341 RepID=UPI003D14C836
MADLKHRQKRRYANHVPSKGEEVRKRIKAIMRKQPTDDVSKRKSTHRTRVTNGKRILQGVDGRGLIARRYYDLYDIIMQDQGGADRMSEVRKQLVRRFAAASVLGEMMEARIANGDNVDIAQHALIASTLVRLSSKIGIDRRSKVVSTPALKDYLESKTQKGTGRVRVIDQDGEDA